MDPEIAALRQALDALDGEILAALARRRALVARLFARKAALGLHRLDAAREAALLEDRASRGEALGVPRGVTDAVFRAVLRMSHALE
ncbi:MAG: chorismate mutase [Polyangiales bacterium]